MPVPRGPRIQIRDLIERAEQQGCKLQLSRVRLDTGGELRTIRYLYNPDNSGPL
jgi:hypothetical protein